MQHFYLYYDTLFARATSVRARSIALRERVNHRISPKTIVLSLTKGVRLVG